MSGGGGKGSSTTTQSNIPWKESQPYVKEIMSAASDIWNQGRDNWIAPNPDQITGLEQIRELAGQGNPLTNPTTYNAENVISSGGMNTQQRSVTDALMPYASGQNLEEGGNPYLEKLIQNNTDDISDVVKSEMAGLGRTGSVAHQGALTRDLGEMMNSLRYGDYDKQVGRQFDAANQVFGNVDTGQQRAFQYSALAPQIGAQRYADANKLADVGGAYRGFEQAEQNFPYEWLGKYANIQNPTGGGQSGFGTSTQTSSGGSDPMSAILGGASLLGGMKSDVRLKENIKRVGKTDGGLSVYTYSYRDDPTGTIQMGVMAQEVLEKNPGAVEMMDDGFMAVYYGEIE